jgi:hypothetical protein
VGQFHFGLQENSGDLSDYLTTGPGGVLSTREITVLPVASWQHVAFVADGLQLRLYRNGVQVGTPTPYDGTFLASPISALGIGVKLNNAGDNADGGAPGFWHGRIDDLALWTRALSRQEIEAIYSAGIEGRPLDQATVQVRLLFSRAGDTLIIRWPASATGYQLESSSAVTDAPWDPVTTTPDVIAGFNTVTELIGAGPRFYRLRQ